MSREVLGDELGGVPVTLIFVDMEPGGAVALHRHPYAEVFVVQSGEATFTIDGEERVARAGEVLAVPPGVAHGFANRGDERLVQLDIHASPRFDTEWL
jgi:quercetin dioxygenase-like cupin family protein